jgi:hypothetical protein
VTLRCFDLRSLLALAGCCSTGVSCTATAPSGEIAWDGLGPTPQEQAVSNDTTPASPPSATKRSRQRAARSSSNAAPGNEWDQEQPAGQTADAKLNRQLKICSNC